MRVIILALLAASAWGQTTVSDTIRVAPGNATFSGEIEISAPDMVFNSTSYARWRQTYTITAGALSVVLIPNDAATPVGTVYSVEFRPSNMSPKWTETWRVPTSGTAVNHRTVKVVTNTTPALIPFLPLAQLGTTGVDSGECIGNISGVWTGVTCAGAGVSTFNSRTGAITPQAGDYSSFYSDLSHVHLIAGITGLQSALDGKEAADATILKSGGSYSDPSWLTLSIAKTTGLQSALDLKAPLASPTFTGTMDATGATATRPIKTGTSMPSPCSTGDVFFKTDATAGSNVFTCISNAWTVISSGEIATAGTGLQKLLSEFSVDNTTTPTVLSGAGAPAGACTGVDLYQDTTAHQLYFCEAGTWRAGGSTAPTASAGTLGLIRIGSGLNIDVDGVVTASVGGGTTGLYSGTLDFGAIPDLGCASLTMTATGLTTGKALALSLPAALETGLIGTAFASAADTATVRLCNVSGASVDPASATFAVRDMDALGYLTASATINYGSIGDGNCAASTITLSGAAAGDNVAAGWPAALESGLTGSMFVSAADTVAVRVCNFSGAAVDPASATFKAAITR